MNGVGSPSGQISPDSRNRSSFGCRSSPSSPISSRNSVPSRAPLISPGLSRSAPVKEPRRWPNSWLSSMSRGTAVQLNGMKGFCARLEKLWMARARISLPVPLSPVISTLTFVLAIRRANAISSRIWPLTTACPPSVGTSSIGQSVRRSSRSARARSRSWMVASRSVTALSVATDSTSGLGSTSTSTVRSRATPTAIRLPSACRLAADARAGERFGPTVAGAGDGRCAAHAVRFGEQVHDLAREQFGAAGVEHQCRCALQDRSRVGGAVAGDAFVWGGSGWLAACDVARFQLRESSSSPGTLRILSYNRFARSKWKRAASMFPPAASAQARIRS